MQRAIKKKNKRTLDHGPQMTRSPIKYTPLALSETMNKTQRSKRMTQRICIIVRRHEPGRDQSPFSTANLAGGGSAAFVVLLNHIAQARRMVVAGNCLPARSSKTLARVVRWCWCGIVVVGGRRRV